MTAEAGGPAAESPSGPPQASAAARSSTLNWEDPKAWRRRPVSSSMRVAEYGVPRAPGDAADGECTVITFGPQQGGGVDENVDRWVRQFQPLSSPPVRTTLRVGGMNVTRVEVAGEYHPMSMPGAAVAPSTQANARLLGAIVEAPSGPWFFKLTGPAATVKAAAADFDKVIASLRAN